MSKLIYREVIASKVSFEAIENCKVYCIRDVILTSEEGDKTDGVEIVFHNEITGCYINLLIEDNGDMNISENY